MLVFVGLGSNLDNPQQQVTQACASLSVQPNITLLRVSSWYQSKPVGPPQPDYINGVAELETDLPAEALLNVLHNIEQQQNRIRDIRWGPRTLDLDILLYGQQVIASARLTVPHAHLTERNFVLTPLVELAPQLQLPDGRSVAMLAQAVGRQGLEQLPSSPRKNLGDNVE
ncbi:2-amino-4-hydroxy-6-hydroxymethyldihydropteridine diphosphokinase [Teredinibacter franksiae]|uniref:2-amino-4-hydroxy-6- hydroxymethyldihydropteridine diphosphokinase n=1 Tax=Teredinibacter franksiae TaxID=2761453 RepID=UPI00162AC40A|nr:2-amino-4-hydroxy-6-hydroxymethyldihydropteridine diphosphokinase [Teredinibacter franksiae]